MVDPPLDRLLETISKLGGIIKFLEKKFYQRRTEHYKRWLEKASDRAFKATHAAIKRHEKAGRSPATGEPYDDPLQLMMSKGTKWANIWHRDEPQLGRMIEAYEQAYSSAKQQEFDPACFDVLKVSTCIRTSRASRATSLDAISIKDLKRLPEIGQGELARLLLEVVEDLALPAQILTPSVSLIPKPLPGGGDRPITVTSTVYMLLMSLLDDNFSDRADQMCSFWDTAVAGSSALRAALYRVALDELAIDEGKSPMTAHWDVEKFYDNINISKLLRCLTDNDMPWRAPVLALQMHLAPRILATQNWVSTPIAIFNSIIAGCKLSNVFAKVFVYPAMQRWHERFRPDELPPMRLQDEEGPFSKEYVDDFTLRQDISTRHGLSTFIQANICFADGLASLDLPLSRRKYLLLGARQQVATYINISLRKAGYYFLPVQSAMDLGVQTSAARRRVCTTMSSTIRKVKNGF